jgi:hypothetical protein
MGKQLIKSGIILLLIFVIAACEDHSITEKKVSDNSDVEPSPAHTILTEETIQISDNEKVFLSGYTVTEEDLIPIANTANRCMAMIDGSDNYFIYKNGDYVNSDGRTLSEFMYSFIHTFTFHSKIGTDYIASLRCCIDDFQNILNVYYRPPTSVDDNSNITERTDYFDLFNLPAGYDRVYFSGGSGSYPNYVDNYFEISEREESKVVLTNTVYYSDDNYKSYYDNNNLVLLNVEGQPAQPGEYDEIITYNYIMVIEEGMWKFETFERWF